METDNALEPLLTRWLAPLEEAQREAIRRQLDQQRRQYAQLSPSERTGLSPDHAVLQDAGRECLRSLYMAWDNKPGPALSKWKRFAEGLNAQTLSLPELDVRMQAHWEQAVREMLWSHERTKATVRSVAKNQFLSTPLPADLNVFDADAVVAHLTATYAGKDTLEGMHQQVVEALHWVGHFTSKPTHTAAAPVAISLPRDTRGIGPYLTAGLIMERGHPLALDRAVNDSKTGRTDGYLAILNEAGNEQESGIRRLVRETAAGLLAHGHAAGTDYVDPRLKQILLPAGNGRYRAITPLTSMGISAYLHGHWMKFQDPDQTQTVSGEPDDQDRLLSFAEVVHYGFSTTSMNNFTAIRSTRHHFTTGKGADISELANRALLFSVPGLSSAHQVLTRLSRKGYAFRLPSWLRTEVFRRYQAQANQVLGQDVQRAIDAERRVLRPILRWLIDDLGELHSQCREAIGTMREGERKVLRNRMSEYHTIVRFILAQAADAPEYAVDFRDAGRSLAEHLYHTLDTLRLGDNRKLGLGTTDKHRFMRWVPDAIASMLKTI